MPKHAVIDNQFISSANLDYTKIDDPDYCFDKVDIMVEAILRGHEFHTACALAQVDVEQMNEWARKDKGFKTLIAWANASYYDVILDSLKKKMNDNAQVPIRVLADYRKRDMEKAVESDVAGELLDILNDIEELNDR